MGRSYGLFCGCEMVFKAHYCGVNERLSWERWGILSLLYQLLLSVLPLFLGKTAQY